MPQKVVYQPFFPLNADMSMLRRLFIEYYLRFPTTTFKVLQTDTSQPHDFYRHATRESPERNYVEYQIHLRPQIDRSTERSLTHHAIDKPRQWIFYICVPEFEDGNVPLPKIGDVFMFDQVDQEYEIMVAKQPSDAFFAHSNYNFERECVCERPSTGD